MCMPRLVVILAMATFHAQNNTIPEICWGLAALDPSHPATLPHTSISKQRLLAVGGARGAELGGIERREFAI